MTQRADRIVLEYTPNDFYYKLDPEKVPPSGECTNSDSLTPYELELCQNKQNVESLLKQQQLHSSMQQKIYDYQSKYYNEVMKSFNLGIGILVIISFLYYNQSTT
jgi:hypothetical protein